MFIIPGERVTSAALDLARNFVRRAERRLVEYQQRQPTTGTIDPAVGNYPKRVCDLLYVLALRAAGTPMEPLSH